jgi:uncharacterized protein (TIGR02246 family)
VNRQTAEEIARRSLDRLGEAWNAGDGGAFGAPFAADADFVAIRGDYHHGREAIGRGHQALFETIYRGSTVTYGLRQARALADSVILVLAGGALTVPTGPLAGEHTSTITLVLVRPDQEADWQIALFHNTLVTPPG